MLYMKGLQYVLKYKMVYYQARKPTVLAVTMYYN